MNETQVNLALPEGYALHWYRVASVLGKGGFGITYLAVDDNLEQQVAIKEFYPEDLVTRGNDFALAPRSAAVSQEYADWLKRFIEEARTLARFDHPNIVRCHSVFEANNTAYMVMRYEDGESLKEILDREGHLDEDTLLSIVLPILDGLRLVHERGFVHRDCQPANIYIRGDGSPVLIDFGAARESSKIERTVTILVAPGYAPYEQYYSNNADQGPWTDVYGLAATLYRAVTGDTPIDAIERSRGLLGSTSDPLVPASVAAAGKYSPAFLAAIDHALAFREADRPQSAAAWAQELERSRGRNERFTSAANRPADSGDTARADVASGLNSAQRSNRSPESAVTNTTPVEPPSRARVPMMFSIAAAIVIGTVLSVFTLRLIEDQAPPNTEIPASAGTGVAESSVSESVVVESPVFTEPVAPPGPPLETGTPESGTSPDMFADAVVEREPVEDTIETMPPDPGEMKSAEAPPPAEYTQRIAVLEEALKKEREARADQERELEAERKRQKAAKEKRMADEERRKQAAKAKELAEAKKRADTPPVTAPGEIVASATADPAPATIPAMSPPAKEPSAMPPVTPATKPATAEAGTGQALATALELLNNGDHEAAVRAFKPLAETGNAVAQYYLGKAYLEGRGIMANSRKGIRWLLASSRSGNVEAQLHLAATYANGVNGRRDHFLAYTWYLVAEQAGAIDSRWVRDAEAEALQAEQLPQAKTLANALYLGTQRSQQTEAVQP